MTEENMTLTTIYSQWKAYQDRLREAIAPLTAEQLALRAAPDLRSIGENVVHIIGCRIGWFTYTLGEDAASVQAHARLEQQGAPAPSASELGKGLDDTWQLISGCLARWSSSDMQQTFPDEADGQIIHVSRAWVVWHVLEHDLHHGGEIALTLGMHGLRSDFTS